MAFLNDHSFRELSSKKKSIAFLNCLLKLKQFPWLVSTYENDNCGRLKIDNYFIIFLDIRSNQTQFTLYHIYSAVCLFSLKLAKGRLPKSASKKTKETNRLTTTNLKFP